MDFAAKHIGFVIAAYGLTFLCLGVLIAALLVKDRRLRAEAGRLEAERRSSRS